MNIEEIAADKVSHDSVEIHVKGKGVFIYTGRDYAETERIIRVLDYIGVRVSNSWNEKCEREHKLESKRLFGHE